MEKLTNKEEEIMRVLWNLKKAFVKEIVAELPEPKPHYNTISTIVRNMEEKGFINHSAFGKSHQYYPAISQEDYKKTFMHKTIQHYFENSYKNVVSFFAKEEKISVSELKEIISIIEKNQNKKA
ncbi:BlaI/MecI/CopY family transcriptional regulator [Lutimonas saemankumensis]|uniref:BlaI/MecI/CopY family transcriptional regulator n=1 Tax=Lutimonas saemankumensis TaxID=483016 RepID=UPI001CD653BA|nr:BlaI/MecI/CopY family transcriptional regulator [Lutimonas saemankumensis]MCA0932423.1 BlaI/MecI/CopY family transcriptional regulator [Lutimonas saemankumensis]